MTIDTEKTIDRVVALVDEAAAILTDFVRGTIDPRMPTGAVALSEARKQIELLRPSQADALRLAARHAAAAERQERAGHQRRTSLVARSRCAQASGSAQDRARARCRCQPATVQVWPLSVLRRMCVPAARPDG